MDESTTEEELVARALSGEEPRLAQLAAEGFLPISVEGLIALQLELGRQDDPALSEKAVTALKESDPAAVNEVLKSAADEVVDFACRHLTHPVILEGILMRPQLDPGLIGYLASWVGPDLQESVLLRQDEIRARPEILARLAANPAVSRRSRRLIGEYQRHLVHQGRDASVGQAADVEGVFDLTEQPTEEELLEVMALAAAGPVEGEVDEETGLSEGQIRSLPVGLRMKLCFGATRAMRDILLRDNNPQIAVGALKHSSISDAEVEGIANQRNVVQEVLVEISQKRRWMARYGTMLALVRNPRTPVGIALRFAPRVGVRDLRSLSTDRGVSEAVRKTARRMYSQKIG